MIEYQNKTLLFSFISIIRTKYCERVNYFPDNNNRPRAPQYNCKYSNKAIGRLSCLSEIK